MTKIKTFAEPATTQVVNSEPVTADLAVLDPNAINAMEVLPPEKQEMARSIARELKVEDTNAVISFGTRAQVGVNASVTPTLNEVAMKDAGPAGELLNELLSNTSDLDPSALRRGRGWLAKISPWANAFSKFVMKYERVGKQMNVIAHRLEGQLEVMRRDIGMLDGLFEKNKQFRENLLVFIAAGDMKIAELRRVHEELAAKALQTGRPEDAQDAADMNDLITRLERRVYDMKLTALVSLQMAPQIRLVQASDQALAEKIQSSILNTIPLWEQQMTLAIALYRQHGALQFQKKVTDTTNQLLTQNARMLKQGTIAVAKEAERGIVEIDTVENSHRMLIETIQETLAIQRQGREARVKGEAVITRLTQELAGQLAQAQNQSIVAPR